MTLYSECIMRDKEILVHESWKDVLKTFFETEKGENLRRFVHEEYQKSVIYPAPQYIFRALNTTPLHSVRVVILGQDPYHGEGQAMGLSFSVPSSTKIPPSLHNIFKEIENDIGITPLPHGDLTRWAEQGVLLLNATLTVQKGLAGSHQKKGWEELTDSLIKKVSDSQERVVFILWGNYAKQKSNLIDIKKHLIITSTHPSPFSAHQGFFGSKPFSQTNTYLKKHGFPEIHWN